MTRIRHPYRMLDFSEIEQLSPEEARAELWRMAESRDEFVAGMARGILRADEEREIIQHWEPLK